ncbi:monooxygenase [Geodermatophilus sp. YIM 151500]|uniref:monooxygenase n=1 Tax=Geodermatophilus sp. YIM 151500 TaxID=2984531 RepID=UPI0021E3A4BB|nr:monooxygenase [Geodermatophilus sp. YIM 151500]MCV2491080.1 monooxygenase [Geodermatophilus sp. YIM 151500]
MHLWRVPTGAVPRALGRMATGPLRLRRAPGLRFAKLLGTGSGRTFTVRDADPRRWALLSVWDDAAAAEAFRHGPLVAGWRRIAEEEWSAELAPLAARGRWSRREPFGAPVPRPWDGTVAAVTRARLALRRAGRFWRAVPPVSADLHRTPGLLLALGIGEAPLGLQGTFSLWRSQAELNRFAYARAAHVDVVRRTASERWYAEELFARFALIGSRGTVDGADPVRAAI